MSNFLATPASGYPTQEMLSSAVYDAQRALARREAIELVSNTTRTDGRLASTTTASALQSAAVNNATQAARSVSDKLTGALGGKLSSVLGSGGNNYNANLVSRKITNMVTGKVQDSIALGANSLGNAVSSALGRNAGGLLGNTLSKLSDGAAKNLAGANIVSGFLETGPKDTALVADPYGVSDNGILNAVSSAVSNTFKNAVESIRRSPDLITDLTNMVATGNLNFSMIKDNLTNRVVGSLGGRHGLLNNLTNNLRNEIIDGPGLPADIFDTAMMVVDGQLRRFDARGMDNARQVYDLMGQITSHSSLNQFFDVGSESALMSATMRELIVLGVPDAVQVLVDKAPHDEVAYNALYANMRVAVEYSDLDTINLMLDLLGPATFLSRVPDAVKVLLTNYRLPIGTDDGNYDNEWEALRTCLDRLHPGWGKVERNGEMINDLAFFSTLSEDAKKLLLREEEYQIAAAIGPHYTASRNLLEELRVRYPMVPLT